MRKRIRARLVITTATLSVASLVACSQILGVEDIPTTGPDAGGDAGLDATKHMDAGHDARNEAGNDARPHTDATNDASIGCTPNATQCSSDGLGVETCGEDGQWGAAASCPAGMPVCLGSSCSCVPGATVCNGQTFSRCVGGPADGGWGPGTVCTSGTCTLTGCGAPPPSCAPVSDVSGTNPTNGVSDCPDNNMNPEGCCTSNEVPAGNFYFELDGLPPYTLKRYAATVSGFRLDRYEVTVGRFRQFMEALSAGGGAWRPEPGSGKHAHLNGGQGLVDRAVDGGATFEPGWLPAWDLDLNALASAPNELQCGGAASWTTGPDGKESLPINCVTWEEAYAFCIWDGGFLPSEAEWNYAASGGDEQRYYPWSAPLSGHVATDAGCENANFIPSGSAPCVSGTEAVGTTSSMALGDSKWSQADMAGNVVEWTLDVSSGGYAKLCSDCALATPPSDAGVTRVQRGGSFISVPTSIRNGVAGSDLQTDRSEVAGVRCARVP